jgi:hypothetical protein
MRKAILLLIAAMMAASGLAQQKTPAPKGQGTAPAKKAGSAQSTPADAPTRAEVLKLFELLQISRTMEIGINAAKAQSREMAEQLIQERAPDATPEQKKQLQTMIDEVMSEAMGPAAIRQMLDATVPVYQRHLTRSDLRAMVDFYSSPVGRKILREQPSMVQESMQAASGIQQKIARSVYLKIDQRMQEIVPPEKEEKQQ